MTTALIGHTGFVGSNLASKLVDFEGFNSKNFQKLEGREFNTVICAGVQAVKWWANQNPEEDWRRIEPLLGVLDTVKAKEFVLISTVDVYREPVGVDETTLIVENGLHPYGLHRRRVETFISDRFDRTWVLRLPGLFGEGLKKNLIYDVLNYRAIDGFDARSSFQFYNLERLAPDIKIVRRAEPGIYNLAVAPVTAASVVEALTSKPYAHHTQAPLVRYDMRSVKLAPWGLAGHYLADTDEVLAEIGSFGTKQLG